MRTNAAVRNGSKGGIRNVPGVQKERMRLKRRQRDANRRQKERRTNGLRSLHKHDNSRQTNDETKQGSARQQTTMINAPCPSRRRGAGPRRRGEEVKSSKTRGGAHYTRHVGGQLRPLLRPALSSACQALLWLLRLPSWALNLLWRQFYSWHNYRSRRTSPRSLSRSLPISSQTPYLELSILNSCVTTIPSFCDLSCA
jgi:hypothetical protein